MKRTLLLTIAAVLMALWLGPAATATEFHVSVKGDDANDGSAAKPFKTIGAAAQAAQPGDVVTVHEGVYRERINPPRGGESDTNRIVYQAAPGETVEVKGSEVVKGWVKVQDNVWKATLPNTFFGSLNPYSELIHGDWFTGKGRDHHTGAVYLDGEWLVEAAKLDEVLAPPGTVPEWLNQAGLNYLLNVAWLRPHAGTTPLPQIPATSFAEKNGTQNAPCTEGGECIGFILNGHWVKYKDIDFKENSDVLEIRAASASDGGIIEIRLDAPDGEIIGSCPIPHTGDWQSWTSFNAKIKPQSGVKTLCLVFKGNAPEFIAKDVPLWFAQVDDKNTTIWAQFKGVDPNEHLVEINVRRAVFYPEKTGINYLTIRGFAMRQAATQWAPPTAEQTAIIGTNWSKGWLIENNTVSHSVCCGIALGKHGDEFDNTSADTAEGYVKTIERAIERGWSKENIGSHVVRNNTISHCEQTGIVGSLGPVFSTITGNTIHDIHVRQLFTGAEMAGIKLHAAIDVEIRGNHIFRTCRGVWLDWMAQGARVSANLFHDNLDQDLFVEVDHGPFVVDNNIFLSPTTLLSVSQGGAYIHNLMAGAFHINHYDARLTPFHKAHSTELAGMHDNPCGDDRYYNNVLVERANLTPYDKGQMPSYMSGNVFLKGAKPSKHEAKPVLKPESNPALRLLHEADGIYLEITLDKDWKGTETRALVDTALLGKAAIPNLPYEQRNGTPLRVDADYAGKPRNDTDPTPGPFENLDAGTIKLKVW